MKVTAKCQVVVKLDVTLSEKEARVFKCAYSPEPRSMSNSDYILASDIRNQLAQSIPDIGDTASPIPWWSNPALRIEYTKTPDSEEQ